jgi:hypothetical protein
MNGKLEYLSASLVDAVMMRRELDRDTAIEWIALNDLESCLREYLEWNGIVGYTDSIMNIIRYKQAE